MNLNREISVKNRLSWNLIKYNLDPLTEYQNIDDTYNTLDGRE